MDVSTKLGLTIGLVVGVSAIAAMERAVETKPFPLPPCDAFEGNARSGPLIARRDVSFGDVLELGPGGTIDGRNYFDGVDPVAAMHAKCAKEP